MSREGNIRDYLRRSPEPTEIALVAEVSDSSLSEDRKQAAIYAGGGIPVYWIVNLVERRSSLQQPGLRPAISRARTLTPGTRFRSMSVAKNSARLP